MPKQKPTAPKTDAEWSAYRVQLNCKVGRDILDGKGTLPPNVTRSEYALYLMFHATEELSKQLTLTTNTQKP